MPATTLVLGLTVTDQHLEEIRRWAATYPDTPPGQPLPAGIDWLLTLLRITATREQTPDAKLEMLQAGASAMVGLIEDWLDEEEDALNQGLNQSLIHWRAILDDMVQGCEDEKDDRESLTT